MTPSIKEILARAATLEMSAEDREAQRRSFAYGNSKIENDRITRSMIDAAAARRPSDR
ncbi:MAG: hypothetical protein K2X76_01845 [Sphingomonas sp.]|nr:hypothetical protein [Sphingomonas sp.]